MPTLNLTNITIKQKEDKNFNKYYLIVDNESDSAYFCFEKAVKDGWNDLVSNWENIREVEIEYETNERGNNKVVSVYILNEGDIII